MTEATIRALFESYAEIAIQQHRADKRVEFEERERGGVVYLIAAISERPSPSEGLSLPRSAGSWKA